MKKPTIEECIEKMKIECEMIRRRIADEAEDSIDRMKSIISSAKFGTEKTLMPEIRERESRVSVEIGRLKEAEAVLRMLKGED